MNDYIYLVITLVIAAAYAWTCYTIGNRPIRHRDRRSTTYLFGRAYYSRSTLDWLSYGVDHARKMTGKELAQYE